MNPARRVAVLGGVRIPFCKNNTAYFDVGNLGMSIKTLGALVEKFGLQGEQLGEVAMGAVLKHSSDWNLGARGDAVLGPVAADAGHHAAARLRHRPGHGDHDRQQDRARADRGRHRRRLGHHLRRADRGQQAPAPAPAQPQHGAQLRRSAWARRSRDSRSREFKPEFPGVGEPRTGKTHGRPLRADGEGMADRARRRRTSSRYESHQKAAAAYERGFFKDLVAPFRGLERDNILRPRHLAGKTRRR